jgi:signal transduction histidine kinase
LGELAQSKDASALKTESVASQGALLAQIQQMRTALGSMPTGSKVDARLLPTLDAIEIDLPTQLDAITNLASSGDWNAVKFRIDEKLNAFEIEASALVKSVDQDFAEEISRSESIMKRVKGRILILVPATAIFTFVIATFFVWAIARKLLELRLEERVNERTRIARDLHDTLLQSFHGLLLSFQTVYDLLPARPTEAKETLGSAIDEAAEAITEGRNAVEGLRSSTVVTNDIAEAIKGIGEELATDGANETSAVFRVEVEGTPRDLHPILRDEAYRIAGEALRNAFRHARARQIEVEIHYDHRQFRLRVRDDGKGIHPDVLGEDGRAGHFGLHGMRERAKLVGGKLAVWSELGSGTEIELTIPGSAAYATPYRTWWSGGLSGKGADETEARKQS